MANGDLEVNDAANNIDNNTQKKTNNKLRRNVIP